MDNYIIPSDNWEQQLTEEVIEYGKDYIIPSDNWEQQHTHLIPYLVKDYIIPSDNWEQQQPIFNMYHKFIISYQAITGNNN